MKRLMQISLTAILLLLLNGCNPSALANMGNEQLDPTLPKLDNARAIPSNTSVAFEWQPMARKGVQGYNIYRTQTNQYVNSPTKELEKIATIRNRFASHYVDTGLQQNSTYTYTFTTLRDGFESPHGKVISIKTLPPFPAVTFLKGYQKAINTIKLLWRPHTDMRVKMYKIERSMNGGEWKWIGTVKHRMMSEYIDSSVAPSNSYTYRVIAVGFDDSFSKPSSNVTIQTR